MKLNGWLLRLLTVNYLYLLIRECWIIESCSVSSNYRMRIPFEKKRLILRFFSKIQWYSHRYFPDILRCFFLLREYGQNALLTQ